jgi:hypothetical protein
MSMGERILEMSEWHSYLDLARKITSVDADREYYLKFEKSKHVATIEPLNRAISINDRIPDISTSNSFKTVVLAHELEHVDGTYYILRMLSPFGKREERRVNRNVFGKLSDYFGNESARNIMNGFVDEIPHVNILMGYNPLDENRIRAYVKEYLPFLSELH